MPRARSSRGVVGALLLGRNAAMQSLCECSGCDVVFEAADYLGWRFSRPCLAWVPDFQDRHLPQLFSSWGRHRRSFGLRLQLLTGRTVLLSSEDAQNDCEKFYPRSKQRTAVARFAVQPALQPGENDPALVSVLHLPPRFFYLPNQYWLHKNHARVIDAMGLLRDRGVAAVVASSGNPKDPRHAGYFAELQSKVTAQGLDANFLFLGNVSAREVAVLMRSAIAVLNPSLCEGWSTTVEEAKSIGARLILSDLKVHREQTLSQAEFFDPRDSESIATTLERVWLEDAIQPSLERQQAAAVHAQNRIREFAFQFARACDNAIERFGRKEA